MKPKTNFGDKQNTNGFDKHPENISGGKPKGAKSRSTILKKWIEINAKISNPETNKIEVGTYEDRIALSLLEKARSGDVPAIREIMDTLYGKIPDKSETKTDLKIVWNESIEDDTDSETREGS